MPASTDIREGLGEAFDALAEEFLSGIVVTLYKQSATTRTFESVLVITSKRFFEYSEYRQNFLLQIADSSGSLTTAMASATHVKIGSDYYVIRTADTIPPQGTTPTWKIFCDRFVERGQFSNLY